MIIVFFVIIIILLMKLFLCKALWITTMYEMCYINKLALPSYQKNATTTGNKYNFKIDI